MEARREREREVYTIKREADLKEDAGALATSSPGGAFHLPSASVLIC